MIARCSEPNLNQMFLCFFSIFSKTVKIDVIQSTMGLLGSGCIRNFKMTKSQNLRGESYDLIFVVTFPSFRMASNNAFETESVDDTTAAGSVLTRKRISNESQNNAAPNEATSFNVHLDTYFSDEKVPIPDQVSMQLSQKYYLKNAVLADIFINAIWFFFSPTNRMDLVSEHYGPSPDQVSTDINCCSLPHNWNDWMSQ